MMWWRRAIVSGHSPRASRSTANVNNSTTSSTTTGSAAAVASTNNAGTATNALSPLMSLNSSSNALVLRPPALTFSPAAATTIHSCYGTGAATVASSSSSSPTATVSPTTVSSEMTTMITTTTTITTTSHLVKNSSAANGKESHHHHHHQHSNKQNGNSQQNGNSGHHENYNYYRSSNDSFKSRFMSWQNLMIGWGLALLTTIWRKPSMLLTDSQFRRPSDIDEWCHRTWDENWDMRASINEDRNSTGDNALKNNNQNSDEKGEQKPRRKRITRYLVLIRHGQYVSDQARSEQLTQLGRLQAEKTAERLKQMPHKFDRILYSDMPRATETAEIISKTLPEVPRKMCSMLREGAPPVHPSPKLSRANDERSFRDGARIEAAFRQYFHRPDKDQEEDSYELIICHANVIRYFICRALQLPPQAWLRMSIAHCGITIFAIRQDGRVSLRAMGDTGHLDYPTFS